MSKIICLELNFLFLLCLIVIFWLCYYTYLDKYILCNKQTQSKFTCPSSHVQINFHLKEDSLMYILFFKQLISDMNIAIDGFQCQKLLNKKN